MEGNRIMSEVKKCPRCGGEMEGGSIRGYGFNPVWFASNERKGILGSKTTKTKAYSCKVCGYVEIYREV
jgi:predicted RNA-binding Zn-ribbon protein involved in translation (DUF1610 family)